MPDGSPGARLFSVYIVRCRDGSFYTGIAVDVARRMEAHRGGVTGARYLRGRAPLELVGQWAVGDRSLATRVERRIKRMSRAAKKELIRKPAGIAAILSDLQAAPAARSAKN